jgi:hypothetical protein
MSYRFERLESIFSSAFPNVKAVIELNHIIEGYSIYLKKEFHEVYLELPASDFQDHFLCPPPQDLADLYEETKRILHRLNILKQEYEWLN